MQADLDETEALKSRSTSRRNSASSRRSSIQKEREGKKKSPLNTAPSSLNSTPKKQVKQNLDFCVTGKQILRKGDRANSLPGYQYQRRPSSEVPRSQRRAETKGPPPQAVKSRDTSLEDDMSLDLSQVDFTRRSQKVESRQSTSSFCSRDSLLYKSSSSASNNRYGGVSTELDYSSVSPEYSGLSSADLSPRNLTRETGVAMALSPRSQDLQLSSCCISSWQDCSDAEQTKVEDYRRDTGEWNSFWVNYNNSVSKVPVKSYYDQCPTPYRTEDINLADLEFSTRASSRKRSPDDLKNINSIIRNEGLHLTPRETQNMIKCAHILGNVLSKAIERRSKEKDLEQEEIVEVIETKNQEENCDEKPGCTDDDPSPTDIKYIKKKSLTLNLKETAIPLEVKEEKRHETVTTQTDISLPNTKSAPKIFEKILRQLSRTSLEESLEKLEKKALESKELEKRALESRELKKKEMEDLEKEEESEKNTEIE